MEKKTIITMNLEDLNGAVADFMKSQGYKVKEVKYFSRVSEKFLSGATVEVEVLENAPVTKLE